MREMNDRKPKWNTKIVRLLVALVAGCMLLAGCGIGEKNEKKLFDAMKENGFLELTCEYEDYDDVREVDQSPVPAVVTYYEYNQGGKLYTIDYSSRILGEDDSVYQVRVSIETEEESNTTVYYFEKDTFEFREQK